MENLTLIPLEDRNARALITGIARRSGIITTVSSHDLRATFATTVYDKTKNIRLVQSLLGHASVNTTMAYLGIDNDQARAAVEFDED
jgi:site-specific recombinase XerD